MRFMKASLARAYQAISEMKTQSVVAGERTAIIEKQEEPGAWRR